MITNYKKFIESLEFDLSIGKINMNESLNTLQQSVLSVIGAEEVDMIVIFGKDFKIDKLEQFTFDNSFQNILRKLNLKHGKVENTEDYETFIATPTKFMMIYEIGAAEIDNPEYLMIQGFNKSINDWEKVSLFQVNGDIIRFYDKLSSKTVEVFHDGRKYLYTTNNGNEWNLISGDEDDTFLKYYRREDFFKFINDNEFKITII